MNVSHAFLVRCWHEGNETSDDRGKWRFSVMEIGDAPQSPQGYADLQAMVKFLSNVLACDPPQEHTSIPSSSREV